ncbi:MAG: hypothetical protein LBS29_05100 [Endomicrobium sp.]|jgi:hypothetical protein|nr:hypothetical protein [Endomicrobium sp.]
MKRKILSIIISLLMIIPFNVYAGGSIVVPGIGGTGTTGGTGYASLMATGQMGFRLGIGYLNGKANGEDFSFNINGDESSRTAAFDKIKSHVKENVSHVENYIYGLQTKNQYGNTNDVILSNVKVPVPGTAMQTMSTVLGNGIIPLGEFTNMSPPPDLYNKNKIGEKLYQLVTDNKEYPDFNKLRDDIIPSIATVGQARTLLQEMMNRGKHFSTALKTFTWEGQYDLSSKSDADNLKYDCYVLGLYMYIWRAGEYGAAGQTAGKAWTPLVKELYTYRTNVETRTVYKPIIISVECITALQSPDGSFVAPTAWEYYSKILGIDEGKWYNGNEESFVGFSSNEDEPIYNRIASLFDKYYAGQTNPPMKNDQSWTGVMFPFKIFMNFSFSFSAGKTLRDGYNTGSRCMTIKPMDDEACGMWGYGVIGWTLLVENPIPPPGGGDPGSSPYTGRQDITAIPTLKQLESNPSSETIIVDLEIKQTNNELIKWNNLFQGFASTGHTNPNFRILVDIKRDGADTGLVGEVALGTDAPIDTQHLKDLLNGKTERSIIRFAESVNVMAPATYNYTSDVTIKWTEKDGSEMSSTLRRDDGLATSSFTPPGAIKYYSEKEPAFAEIKAGTYYPHKEPYNAMQGTVTTTNLYFASGGSEFVVEMDAEVADLTYSRTYRFREDAKDCGQPEHAHGSDPVVWESEMIPALESIWTQAITGGKYLKINNLKVWKLDRAKVEGVKSLILDSEAGLSSEDNGGTIYVDEGSGLSIIYNISGLADNAATGRVWHSFQLTGQSEDTVTIYDGEGKSLNEGHSYLYNGRPYLIAELNKIINGNEQNINPVTGASGYSEWEDNPIVVSDFLILRTTNGDQSIIYYEQKAKAPKSIVKDNTFKPGPNTAEAIEMEEADENIMWTTNTKTAAGHKMHADDITYGGYNGKFKDMENKYISSGKPQNIVVENLIISKTGYNFNPASGMSSGATIPPKAITEPLRLAATDLNLYDWTDGGNMYLMNENKIYEPTYSSVWYEELVDYSSGGVWESGNKSVSGDIFEDGFSGYGFEHLTRYSLEHNKINDVIVFNPVVNEEAMIVSLDDARDQRTDAFKNIQEPQIEIVEECPEIAEACAYAIPKELCDYERDFPGQHSYTNDDYTVIESSVMNYGHPYNGGTKVIGGTGGVTYVGDFMPLEKNVDYVLRISAENGYQTTVNFSVKSVLNRILVGNNGFDFVQFIADSSATHDYAKYKLDSGGVSLLSNPVNIDSYFNYINFTSPISHTYDYPNIQQDVAVGFSSSWSLGAFMIPAGSYNVKVQIGMVNYMVGELTNDAPLYLYLTKPNNFAQRWSLWAASEYSAIGTSNKVEVAKIGNNAYDNGIRLMTTNDGLVNIEFNQIAGKMPLASKYVLEDESGILYAAQGWLVEPIGGGGGSGSTVVEVGHTSNWITRTDVTTSTTDIRSYPTISKELNPNFGVATSNPNYDTTESLGTLQQGIYDIVIVGQHASTTSRVVKATINVSETVELMVRRFGEQYYIYQADADYTKAIFMGNSSTNAYEVKNSQDGVISIRNNELQAYADNIATNLWKNGYFWAVKLSNVCEYSDNSSFIMTQDTGALYLPSGTYKVEMQSGRYGAQYGDYISGILKVGYSSVIFSNPIGTGSNTSKLSFAPMIWDNGVYGVQQLADVGTYGASTGSSAGVYTEWSNVNSWKNGPAYLSSWTPDPLIWHPMTELIEGSASSGVIKVTALNTGCAPKLTAVLTSTEPHRTFGNNYQVYTLGMYHIDGEPSTGIGDTNTSPIIFPGTNKAYTIAEILATGALYQRPDGIVHLSMNPDKCDTCGSYSITPLETRPGYTNKVVNGGTQWVTEYEHYPFGDSRCWEPCLNDDNHKHSASEAVDENGDRLEMGDFLNLDWDFRLYYPNVGDFYGDGAKYSSEVSKENGFGYEDDMDVTEWLLQKYVIFPFEVVFEGDSYLAGQPVFLEEAQVWFDFYLPLGNQELNNAIVKYHSIGINNPYKEQDNDAETNYPKAQDYSAKHAAFKQQQIDVVGRIGALTIEDTGDFRFSNLFKQTLVGQWLVKNVLYKVNYRQQNKIVADVYDVRGVYQFGNTPKTTPMDTVGQLSTTTRLDTYGTSGERRKEFIEAPLTPYDNNVPSLQRQPVRLGYDVYMDLTTLGLYYGENATTDTNYKVQIKPYYYHLDLNNGKWTPVDVYYEKDNTNLLINKFYDDDTRLVQNYMVSVNWLEEAWRRNHFSGPTIEAAKRFSVDDVTMKVKDAYDDADEAHVAMVDPVLNGETGIPIATKPLPIPAGDNILFGTIDSFHLMENQTGISRTFVGSELQNEINHDPGFDNPEWYAEAELPVDTPFPDVYKDVAAQRNGVRWNFTVGLPSSATFVEAKKPYTEANVKALANSHSVIVCAADIVAHGVVWDLKYDGNIFNMAFNVVKNVGGTPGPLYDPITGKWKSNPSNPSWTNTGSTTVPADRIVLAVFYADKSSKDDLRTEGTQ